MSVSNHPVLVGCPLHPRYSDYYEEIQKRRKEWEAEIKMSIDADRFMQNYRELYNDRDAIMWLFHDRCIMCGQQAQEINEIIPRSRTKEATKMWKNQVALCHNCHTLFHQNGVTLQKQREMLGKRKEFLTSIGRERFI